MSKPGETRRVKRKGGMKGDWAPSVTLVDKIADELRERIIDGTFQAGEHLQQATLAKKMGVSSIPLREAIRMLEAEGFVEIVPFKGARVKHLSAEEIVERAKIAFALETYAVELTLPTLTDEDLDRAEELANGLYPVSDINTWYARSSELLGILFGAKHWPVLYNLILRNRMAARRYTEILVRRTIQDPKWAKQWASGYFPLFVELLRERDLGAVKALHRSRMEEYVDLLLPWLEAGAGRVPRRRGALGHLRKPKSSRGRK